MTTDIRHGHVLDVLSELPAGRFQVCVTSPPFFGLRSYSTEPQIWGGSGECGDEHEWGDEVVTGRKATGNYYASSGLNRVDGESYRNRLETYAGTIGTSNLCRRCHAWSGELGQEGAVDCLGWARGEPPESCQVGCYMDHLRLVMAGLRRVLRDDGLCFVELADSYSSTAPGTMGDELRREGIFAAVREETAAARRKFRPKTDIPPKSLFLVPERFRLAMLSDGWVVRSVIRWAKVAPMPESVTDRPTSAVSEVVMLAKQPRYFSDMLAVAERSVATHGSGNGYARDYQLSRGGRGQAGEWRPGENPSRNIRNWTALSPEPSKLSHYASFGPKAIAPFLKLATSEAGCCPNPECGSAWERVTERDNPRRSAAYEALPETPKSADFASVAGDPARARLRGAPSSALAKPGWREFPEATTQTTGWRARCTCGLPESSNVPCRCIDIFGGSGTVGVVAEKLGLDCTLIDLAPNYVEMSRLRLALEGMPLFAANGHAPDAEPVPERQAAMIWGEG